MVLVFDNPLHLVVPKVAKFEVAVGGFANPLHLVVPKAAKLEVAVLVFDNPLHLVSLRLPN